MRITDPVVRLEADQQNLAPRVEGAQQPQAVESSVGQPGLQVQISESAREALATGAPEGQDDGAASVNAYRQGARRAPPVQDWALDWTALNEVPVVVPEAEPQPRPEVAAQEAQAPEAEDLSLFRAAEESVQGVNAGRNVGAIYLQNATERPQELGIPQRPEAPAEVEPADHGPVLADAVSMVDLVD